MSSKEGKKIKGKGIWETGKQLFIYFVTKLASQYLFLKRLGNNLLSQLLKPVTEGNTYFKHANRRGRLLRMLVTICDLSQLQWSDTAEDPVGNAHFSQQGPTRRCCRLSSILRLEPGSSS